MYGVSAIYCITPVSEEVARTLAKSLVARPVTVWLPSAQNLIATPPYKDTRDFEDWRDEEEDGEEL